MCVFELCSFFLFLLFINDCLLLLLQSRLSTSHPLFGFWMLTLLLWQFESFNEFAQLYPEFRHVFIGDNGQGDVRAGEMMMGMEVEAEGERSVHIEDGVKDRQSSSATTESSSLSTAAGSQRGIAKRQGSSDSEGGRGTPPLLRAPISSSSTPSGIARGGAQYVEKKPKSLGVEVVYIHRVLPDAQTFGIGNPVTWRLHGIIFVDTFIDAAIHAATTARAMRYDTSPRARVGNTSRSSSSSYGASAKGAASLAQLESSRNSNIVSGSSGSNRGDSRKSSGGSSGSGSGTKETSSPSSSPPLCLLPPPEPLVTRADGVPVALIQPKGLLRVCEDAAADFKRLDALPSTTTSKLGGSKASGASAFSSSSMGSSHGGFSGGNVSSGGGGHYTSTSGHSAKEYGWSSEKDRDLAALGRELYRQKLTLSLERAEKVLREELNMPNASVPKLQSKAFFAPGTRVIFRRRKGAQELLDTLPRRPYPPLFGGSGAEGIVRAFRPSDGVYTVELLSWRLARDHPVKVFATLDQLDHASSLDQAAAAAAQADAATQAAADKAAEAKKLAAAAVAAAAEARALEVSEAKAAKEAAAAKVKADAAAAATAAGEPPLPPAAAGSTANTAVPSAAKPVAATAATTTAAASATSAAAVASTKALAVAAPIKADSSSTSTSTSSTSVSSTKRRVGHGRGYFAGAGDHRGLTPGAVVSTVMGRGTVLSVRPPVKGQHHRTVEVALNWATQPPPPSPPAPPFSSGELPSLSPNSSTPPTQGEFAHQNLSLDVTNTTSGSNVAPNPPTSTSGKPSPPLPASSRSPSASPQHSPQLPPQSSATPLTPPPPPLASPSRFFQLSAPAAPAPTPAPGPRGYFREEDVRVLMLAPPPKPPPPAPPAPPSVSRLRAPAALLGSGSAYLKGLLGYSPFGGQQDRKTANAAAGAPSSNTTESGGGALAEIEPRFDPGAAVRTAFGGGRVVEYRSADNMYEISLSPWGEPRPQKFVSCALPGLPPTNGCGAGRGKGKSAEQRSGARAFLRAAEVSPRLGPGVVPPAAASVTKPSIPYSSATSSSASVASSFGSSLSAALYSGSSSTSRDDTTTTGTSSSGSASASGNGVGALVLTAFGCGEVIEVRSRSGIVVVRIPAVAAATNTEAGSGKSPASSLARAAARQKARGERGGGSRRDTTATGTRTRRSNSGSSLEDARRYNSLSHEGRRQQLRNQRSATASPRSSAFNNSSSNPRSSSSSSGHKSNELSNSSSSRSSRRYVDPHEGTGDKRGGERGAGKAQHQASSNPLLDSPDGIRAAGRRARQRKPRAFSLGASAASATNDNDSATNTIDNDDGDSFGFGNSSAGLFSSGLGLSCASDFSPGSDYGQDNVDIDMEDQESGALLVPLSPTSGGVGGDGLAPLAELTPRSSNEFLSRESSSSSSSSIGEEGSEFGSMFVEGGLSRDDNNDSVSSSLDLYSTRLGSGGGGDGGGDGGGGSLSQGHSSRGTFSSSGSLVDTGGGNASELERDTSTESLLDAAAAVDVPLAGGSRSDGGGRGGDGSGSAGSPVMPPPQPAGAASLLSRAVFSPTLATFLPTALAKSWDVPPTSTSEGGNAATDGKRELQPSQQLPLSPHSAPGAPSSRQAAIASPFGASASATGASGRELTGGPAPAVMSGVKGVVAHPSCGLMLYLQPEEILTTVPALVGHRVIVNLLGSGSASTPAATRTSSSAASTNGYEGTAKTAVTASTTATSSATSTTSSIASSSEPKTSTMTKTAVNSSESTGNPTTTSGAEAKTTALEGTTAASATAPIAAAAVPGATAVAAAAPLPRKTNASSASGAMVRGRVVRVRLPPLGGGSQRHDQPLFYEIATDWGALLVCPAHCVARDHGYWARQTRDDLLLGSDSGLLKTASSWWAKAKFW